MQHPISPLDGRYGSKLEQLSHYFSEKALMRMRTKVELMYLLALNDTQLFTPMNEVGKRSILRALDEFTEEDYQQIKTIERTTNHDVKAVEIFLREKLSLQDNNLIHFALTSEDINNLAHSLLLKEYLEEVHLPQIKELIKKLAALANDWKSIPFPARTHGQKASPSTAGKELAVFINRLVRQYKKLKDFRFSGKINGAVGNYSAMLAAFPDYDWIHFSNKFLENIGLEANIATTQIEDHDTWAAYFNITRQINNIVMDLDVDCWLYISRDLFSEQTKEGEVGSSTMPHKVNPINFENSEGNLSLSNALLVALSDRLCRSRMQRDLSDSTVSRNIGVGLAHSHLAIKETLKGLNKLKINKELCISELNNSPELLAEPIQTILKTANVDDPYNLLKAYTRGKKLSSQDINNFITSLDVPDRLKERMRLFTPINYIGDAVRVCELVLEDVKSI